MLGWLRPTPTLPLDPETTAWIDSRWQWLGETFGADAARHRPVVLPSPEFFPDRFTSDPEDIRAMFRRVCGFMGVDPKTVELNFYLEGDAYGTGAAGLYQEQNGVFHVFIEITNLDDPLALVGVMAHELGHVLLLGHRRIDPDCEDHEPLTDLLTVWMGLGLFTANSVVRDKTENQGLSTVWRIRRLGYLTMPMYGYALARLAWLRDEPRPKWERELRPDVRAAFRRTIRYFQSCGEPPPVETNLPQPKVERGEALGPLQATIARCRYCRKQFEWHIEDMNPYDIQKDRSGGEWGICPDCMQMLAEHPNDEPIADFEKEAPPRPIHWSEWYIERTLTFIWAAGCLGGLIYLVSFMFR